MIQNNEQAKLLMSLKEASEFSGLGINKLREISNERDCPFVLFVGNKRMIKRDGLISFINNSYSI